MVSRSYPYAEFVHEKDLIGDKVAQEKFNRRGQRFLNTIKTQKVDFLHGLPASAITDKATMDAYLDSVSAFQQLLTNGQHLYIYIRFDESTEENKEIMQLLIEQLRQQKGISVASM